MSGRRNDFGGVLNKELDEAKAVSKIEISPSMAL